MASEYWYPLPGAQTNRDVISMVKTQITSTKFQINPKSRYPNTKAGLALETLVIVIYLEFVIWHLEFASMALQQSCTGSPAGHR